MADTPSRGEIEKLLGTFKRALHPRELASRLSIPPEDYSELIARLDEIEQDGKLTVLPGGRVKLKEIRTSKISEQRNSTRPGRRGDSPGKGDMSFPQNWVGTLSAHAKGFGFVASPGHDDVFIPADALYEALHGDKVVVRVTGQSKKGLEGVVERVEARRDPKIAGVIRKKRAGGWLEPDDSRIRGPITLVGDLSSAYDGDAAVVEITRFPLFSEELPEAKILEVLGPAGDPQTEVKKILIRESVTEEHSAEALKNAEQMASRLGSIRLGNRRDLRSVPLPTIDPEDARDHDDAVWVERTKTGYRVYVAIADVSEYVRPESPLDEEARARGCTIYLPDRAIPMLPRALAGDLCSLLPEVDRFCMCVIAEMDKGGVTKSFEIVEGVMRSAAKLTYAGVARTLGFDPESPQSPQADAFKSDLQVLAELAEKLRKNRMQRGALDLDLPEARIVIDPESGAPVEVKKRATRPGLKRAYSLIEELMLLANELVAQWLNDKDAPAIYRIHAKPDEEKLERLTKVTDNLGMKIDIEELTKPHGVSRFLASIQNHDRKNVLEMLLLRSLKQAVYEVDNIGHFGLASERYLHFTSPIRRYPDLRVHRQIKNILRGGKIDNSDEAIDDLKAAAGESSKKERAAMEIEREVLNLYRAIFMGGHIGEVYEAKVTGISGGGLYCSVDDPCVDVMIPFDMLGLDQYELDEDELGVVGQRSGERIMMGDALTVQIKDTSIVRRTVYAKRITEGQEADAPMADGDWDAPAYSMDDFSGGRQSGPENFRPGLGARKTFRSTTTTARERPGARAIGRSGAARKGRDDRESTSDDRSPRGAQGPRKSGGKSFKPGDRPGARGASKASPSKKTGRSTATAKKAVSGRAAARKKSTRRK